MILSAALLWSSFLALPAQAVPADPFLWLEDANSAPTKTWSDQHDAAAREALAGRPGRGALRRELEAIVSSGSLRGLAVRGSRVFYLKRAGSAEQPVLYVRDGARSEPRAVLDANRLGREGLFSLAWWQPSPDGLLLAYGVAQPETGEVELRIREVDSAADLPDRISRVAEPSVAWLPDRTGFYYVRMPAAAAVAAGAAPRSQRVLFHPIGTDPALDAVAVAGGSPDDRHEVQISGDGRILVDFVRRGFDRADVFVYDRESPSEPAAQITAGRQAAYRGRMEGSILYLLTDDRASRGRILAADLRRPRRPRWRELIPEGPFTTTDFAMIRNGIAVSVLERATARLQLHDRKGKPLREIALPGAGSVTALAADSGRDEVHFIWESFIAPPALYRYDARKSSMTALDSIPGPEADELKMTQVEFPGPDGRPTAMFLVSSRWLKRDGANPAILTGLGCCGRLTTPAFSPLLRSWIRRGGLWAGLVLRGGGEYGRLWHESGEAAQRQKTVSDFIAAGRWLVGKEYTRPGRLAALGQGFGGLTAAAAAVQAPELFAAAVLREPLADLRRYHLLAPGRSWLSEFGSPDDLRQWPWLETLSPYARVLAGARLPATLILDGPCPDGPDPAHGRKLAAALEMEGAPALWRWEPFGCAEPALSYGVAADMDIEAFLFWSMRLEKNEAQAVPARVPRIK